MGAGGTPELTPGWDKQTHSVPSGGGKRDIFHGAPEDSPPPRNPPTLPGVPLFGPDFDFMACSNTKRSALVCNTLLSVIDTDPDLGQDPEDVYAAYDCRRSLDVL